MNNTNKHRKAVTKDADYERNIFLLESIYSYFAYPIMEINSGNGL